MRISHRHRFVFISKHKCASSAIRIALEPFSDIVSCQSYPYYHHTTAKKLKRHFSEQGRNWDDYYSFISIRNPWQMLVSLYCYGMPDTEGNYYWNRHWDQISREIHLPEHRLVPPNAIGFREWIMTYDFKGFSFDTFAKDDAGNLLVKDVISVENIDRDFGRVIERIGLDPNTLKLPRKNTTFKAGLAITFDDEMNDIIARDFASDIAVGGYTPPARTDQQKPGVYDRLSPAEVRVLFQNERKSLLEKYWQLFHQRQSPSQPDKADSQGFS
jgi:hypothetical protein